MSGSAQSTWTFFTNHGHVLLCLATDPDSTVREVAAQVGITERATIRIIGELEDGGVLERTREGRRNHYTINRAAPLRHELEKHRKVGDLIRLLGEPQDG